MLTVDPGRLTRDASETADLHPGKVDVMADDSRATRGPLPLVQDEADILPVALGAAARSGDADPELVQHVKGTREEITKTTGSWVHSDEPSYLIAIRGNFTRRVRRPPGPDRDQTRNETEPYSVKVLVVEIKSGRITDGGSGRTYPDLSAASPVVTDYRRSP
jgi:hypothetical protein